MKNLNFIDKISITVICSAILLLISCQPNVLFQEAMPPDVVSIDKVPKLFQGIYLCESDSSRMYAEDYVVFNETYHMFVTHIDKVKETENCSIVAGGLYLPGRRECVPFEYVGEDTIKAKVYTIDTLFDFSENQVLKEYKGRLFMNYMNEYNEWVTYMISPMADGSMKWELIDVPDKIKEVEGITHDYTTRLNKDEETMYIIKPTLVDFERILSREYTSTCDILIPINLEF